MTEQKARTINRAGLQHAADRVNCAKAIPVDRRSPGRHDGLNIFPSVILLLHLLSWFNKLPMVKRSPKTSKSLTPKPWKDIKCPSPYDSADFKRFYASTLFAFSHALLFATGGSLSRNIVLTATFTQLDRVVFRVFCTINTAAES